MNRFTRSQWANRLALVAMLLAMAASAVGLLVPGLYRDSEAWVRQAQASDLTTLAIAVPLLSLGLWRGARGSAVAYLLALGSLGYLAYGYAIFSFSVATNAMTPVHYAILGLASWSLFLNVAELDLNALSAHGIVRLPRRRTGWFLIGVAALFLLLWGGQIATSIATGATAPEVAALGLTANPVWALDLAFALPLFAVAGVLMLRAERNAIFAVVPVLAFIAVMGVSILVIFGFDAMAGQRVDLVPVILIATLVATAALLIATGGAPQPIPRPPRSAAGPTSSHLATPPTYRSPRPAPRLTSRRRSSPSGSSPRSRAARSITGKAISRQGHVLLRDRGWQGHAAPVRL